MAKQLITASDCVSISDCNDAIRFLKEAIGISEDSALLRNLEAIKKRKSKMQKIGYDGEQYKQFLEHLEKQKQLRN